MTPDQRNANFRAARLPARFPWQAEPNAPRLMDAPRRINLPDAIGAGLVTGGGALMGVGAALTAGQQQTPPLQLFPKEGEWRLFAGTAWGSGIPVRVVNVTEEPNTLAYYRLLIEPDVTQRPPLAHDVHAAVNRWTDELSAKHASELFTGEIPVEPGKPVTRWFIGWVYASLPDGGRPALTLQFEDVSGDTYKANVPARPRQDY
jgi:hypothetical protein